MRKQRSKEQLAKEAKWARDRRARLKNDPEYKARKKAQDMAFAERNRKTTEVYYLPEEHYIGITHYLPTRLAMHRKAGKITEGAIIVASFERHVDAAWLEVMFHQRGYNGYKYQKTR